MNNGLTTDNLAIGYDRDLISGIALSVQSGKIVTLIGPNGSGKSTLLKTITGQLKSRGGIIFLDGKDKSAMSGKEIAENLSMVMTTTVRPELMTCREVIESGRYPYTGRFGKLSYEDRQKVSEAMELTETVELADTLFTNISDGQRQRVMLARSIAQEPNVLVLDEPTSFLDIKYKADILGKIKDLTEKKNIAVLMSIHEPEIAMRLSDTVVALGDGKVMRVGTPEEVFEEAFIRELYNLGDADISLTGGMPFFDRNAPAEDPSHTPPGAKAFSRGVIMVQGTMSNVGKSIIAGGLCRIFVQDGFKVAPFKSQNMALNSFVTDEGLEMGRAQVVQAECAKTAPKAAMNPVLLKPVSDCGSQVIVNGKPVGNMKAAEYYEYKKTLIPVIKEAYDTLRAAYDIIVIEGAGSPAEINLKDGDIVNMGLAEMVNAPVLLVGDIDRGGVFAQLLGTLDLLEDNERARVTGLVINKFRGDKALLEPGIRMLEERAKCPVTGVVPYMSLDIDDEDSLSERLSNGVVKDFDIAVIRLLHISNFTDLDVFSQSDDISVRYVSKPSEIGKCDLIVIPGTKNTIGDMRWLKESGMADEIKSYAAAGGAVIGICGGYQMLGRTISDPENTETGGREDGLSLLPVDTELAGEKTRRAFEGTFTEPTGVLSSVRRAKISGYEIHMGVTTPYEDISEFTSAGSGYCRKNVYGTYVHGLFDRKESSRGIIEALSKHANKSVDTKKLADRADNKEKEYDRLADALRKSLDMKAIYEMMGLK